VRCSSEVFIVDLPIKNGDFPWDLMGFIRIYDGIPSGYVKIAIENGDL
jgi:hypothetical protein